jgi:hypothetical protein
MAKVQVLLQYLLQSLLIDSFHIAKAMIVDGKTVQVCVEAVVPVRLTFVTRRTRWISYLLNSCGKINYQPLKFLI